MRKIGDHSREGVIDFIEKSGNASWMRRHYQHLLIHAGFKKRLEEISYLMRHRALVCRIVYDHQQEDQKSIIHRIEKHLTLSGIKTVLDKRESTPPLADFINENSHNKEYLLYVLSRELVDLFQADRKKQKSSLSHLLQKFLQNPDSTFLWLDHTILEIPQEFLKKGCVDFRDQENYDVSIFKILKRILPDIPLDPIISEFKKQKESIHGSSGKRFSPDTLSSEDLKQKKTLFVYIMEHVLKYRRGWFLIVSLLALSDLCYWFLVFKRDQANKTSHNESLKPLPFVQSNFMMMPETSLLERPVLMAKIQEKLKGQEGIQTIALVGVGGSGKTTLAQQVAHQQKASVVWKVNTETQETLMESFETLAEALSQTQEDKKIFLEIQEIKNTQKRKEKIIVWVRQKLHAHSNWFLILGFIYLTSH